jgi:polysaccharide biosynthesis transport protein
MSLGQLISIIRARWWVAALVLLLTAGLTIGISLALPKNYSASASVVVDTKPDPVSALAFGGQVSPAFMATQIDVIQSDRVALRVARNLKLADNPQVRAQWQESTGGEGTIESWLSDTFRRNMTVTPSRESNVLTISYSAPDPRFAAGLANAFVQAYIDTSLDLRTDPAKRFSSFFDTRLREARDSLEAAQQRLSAFQKDKGLIATDERLDIETARLNELSSQLVAIEAVATESSSRQGQASGEGIDKLPEVLNNGLIGSLKSELAGRESRMQELTSRLGDSHPQVIEQRASLAELKRKLETETRRVSGGIGVTNNINRQRERQIRSELELQRGKVLRLKTVRDESSVLLRDIENSQRAYDAVQARFNQTSLESLATQSNINVLTEATAPSQPSSPKVVLNSILGVFFGLLLGVGLVLLMEFMDRRARGSSELSEALDLPLLGVLPASGSRRSERRNAQSLMHQRIVGRLAAPARGN